jgi:hypothetical protein
MAKSVQGFTAISLGAIFLVALGFFFLPREKTKTSPAIDSERTEDEENWLSESERKLTQMAAKIETGMPLDTVVQELGEPSERNTDNLVFYAWNPRIPNNGQRKGPYGLVIYFDDQKVTNWTEVAISY